MKSAYWLRNLFRALAAASLAFVVPGLPHAHTQTASTPTTPLGFDAATVKPVDPNKMNMIELRVYPGGRLVIHAYTLRGLIEAAFNLPAWQVVGGQKWVDESRFDIEGKPSAELRMTISGGEFSNSGLQGAQVRSMLQALLIDRFHLKFHMESQQGTVYLLKRGNGPLRLESAELNLYKRSEDGSITPSDAYPTGDVGMAGGRPLSIHQTSMLQLASVLSSLLQVPVNDETGLPGFYNFKSQTVVTNEDIKSGGAMHLLVEAVPEMGLKLVQSKGAVEKFVIDNVEQPTAN